MIKTKFFKTDHWIRKLLFVTSLKVLKRDNIVKYFEEIATLNRLSKENKELEELKRVKEILIDANKNTKYYSNLFKKHKFKPENMKSLKELQKIPILTKKDIQQNYNDLISNKYEESKLIKNSTGGSTGNTLNYLQTNKYYEYGIAYQYYNWYRTGYKFGDKIAYLWGSEYDYNFRKIIDKINDLVTNRIYFNTFKANEKEYLNYAKKLKKYKPKLIVGYTGSVYLFAKVIKKHNIKGINPRAIQLSAETVFDYQRKLIEEVFKTKVYNSYGSREVGSIAHQCSKTNLLHTSLGFNYVEIVKSKNNNDNTGKIIVTNLINNGMPFIRYEIGDVGEEGNKCTCNSTNGGLKKVAGRITDTITTPEGSYVHGEYFTHLIYGIKEISKFQFIQEKIDVITVKIVQQNLDIEKFEKSISNKIKQEISNNFKIKFEYPKEIPVTKSGKYRFTISKI